MLEEFAKKTLGKATTQFLSSSHPCSLFSSPLSPLLPTPHLPHLSNFATRSSTSRLTRTGTFFLSGHSVCVSSSCLRSRRLEGCRATVLRMAEGMWGTGIVMNTTKLGLCENKGWPCPYAYRTCRDTHVLCCLLTSPEKDKWAIVSLVSTRVKCCLQRDTKPFVFD